MLRVEAELDGGRLGPGPEPGWRGNQGSFRKNPNQEGKVSWDPWRGGPPEKCREGQPLKETFEIELVFLFFVFSIVGGRAELGFGTGDRAPGQAFTSFRRSGGLLLRT